MLLKISAVATLFTLISGTYNIGQNSGQELSISDNENRSVAKDSCVPSNVPYFMTTWLNDTIHLEWTAPETCVRSFLVYLNEDAIDIPYDSSVKNYNYSYDGLAACTEYSTTVVVVGEDGTTSERIDLHYTTLVPTIDPGPVSDVTIAASDDSMEISWNPPDLHANCISYYELSIVPSTGSSVTVKQTNTSYVFTPLLACVSYTIRIYAYIESNRWSVVKSTAAFPETVPEAPQLIGVLVQEASARVTLSLDQPLAPTPCRVKYMRIQCTINDFLGFSFTQSYGGTSSSPNAVIDITTLAKNATYSCQATAENSLGTSEPSEPFTFVTN